VLNCDNNFRKTRAGNRLYIATLHKHLFYRWFNDPFSKASQAAMNLCMFQAVAVRKPRRSTWKSAADFLGEIHTGRTKILLALKEGKEMQS